MDNNFRISRRCPVFDPFCVIRTERNSLFSEITILQRELPIPSPLFDYIGHMRYSKELASLQPEDRLVVTTFLNKSATAKASEQDEPQENAPDTFVDFEDKLLVKLSKCNESGISPSLKRNLVWKILFAEFKTYVTRYAETKLVAQGG